MDILLTMLSISCSLVFILLILLLILAFMPKRPSSSRVRSDLRRIKEKISEADE